MCISRTHSHSTSSAYDLYGLLLIFKYPILWSNLLLLLSFLRFLSLLSEQDSNSIMPKLADSENCKACLKISSAHPCHDHASCFQTLGTRRFYLPEQCEVCKNFASDNSVSSLHDLRQWMRSIRQKLQRSEFKKLHSPTAEDLFANQDVAKKWISLSNFSVRSYSSSRSSSKAKEAPTDATKPSMPSSTLDTLSCENFPLASQSEILALSSVPPFITNDEFLQPSGTFQDTTQSQTNPLLESSLNHTANENSQQTVIRTPLNAECSFSTATIPPGERNSVFVQTEDIYISSCQ